MLVGNGHHKHPNRHGFVEDAVGSIPLLTSQRFLCLLTLSSKAVKLNKHNKWVPLNNPTCKTAKHPQVILKSKCLSISARTCKNSVPLLYLAFPPTILYYNTFSITFLTNPNVKTTFPPQTARSFPLPPTNGTTDGHLSRGTA